MRPALLVCLGVLLAGCAAPAPAADPEDPAAGHAAAAGVAPRHVLTGHHGPEPSLGVTSRGTLFMAAWDEVLRSRDGGRTWDAVRHLLPQDDGLPTGRQGGILRTEDPMLWVDPVTDRVWAAPMFPLLLCAHLSWSDDEGETWTERPGACRPPPYDHPKLVSGPPGPEAPPAAGLLYPTVLYDCYHGILYQGCATSYDGGLSWTAHALASDAATGGHRRESLDGCTQNGRPAVAPDGTLAIPLSKGCPAPTLAVSRDSGLTWTVRQGPADAGADQDDHAAAFAPDGTLHVAYPSADNVLHLARTRDLGVTWEGPFRVAPPEVGTTAFQAIATGAQGRVAIAFLGTEEAAGLPDRVGDEARWHLYVAVSEDAHAEAPTFSAWRVTPEDDPVQVGPICTGGTTCLGGARNLADFIDARKGPDGTFYVAYADGCVDACAKKERPTPQESRAGVAALAWLEGWSLDGPLTGR